MQQYDGHLAVCPPKTPHSVRTIALDHTTVAALRAHRDRQRAEASAFGPGYRASGYVFTGLNGDPMAPDRLSRAFKKLAADAGLPSGPTARVMRLPAAPAVYTAPLAKTTSACSAIPPTSRPR